MYHKKGLEKSYWMVVFLETMVETIAIRKPKNTKTNLKHGISIKTSKQFWGAIYLQKGLEKAKLTVKCREKEKLAKTITIRKPQNAETFTGTWYVHEKILKAVDCYIQLESS